MLLVHLLEVLHEGLSSDMFTVNILLVTAGEALGDQVLLTFLVETELWVFAGLAKDKLENIPEIQIQS